MIIGWTVPNFGFSRKTTKRNEAGT